MRPLVAASVIALTLAGCTLNTSAAEERCARTLYNMWRENNPYVSNDTALDKALYIAEACSEIADEEPQQFLKDWG
jgi:hypothetical protein